MNKEKKIINNFLSQLPKSSQHINDFFESDAEIIDFGSKQMLFTTDEFSGEDMLRDDDPYMLGWNMAVCTISDILASGGTPKFYAHSVQVSKNWDHSYIENFSKGIADVLNLSGAAFIGGDLGMSKV
ncbi:MAG: hypothetical protein K8R58_03045, partial [Bacteroidales bacterium]|nr:hypothetical protein [Bacteroidales bacterium]